MSIVNRDLLALIEAAKQTDEYWVETAKMDFAVRLSEVCKKAGISKSSLAKKLGTSQAYISKVFRGDTNFTIETMVRIASAVGAKVEVNIVETPMKATAKPAIRKAAFESVRQIGWSDNSYFPDVEAIAPYRVSDAFQKVRLYGRPAITQSELVV